MSDNNIVSINLALDFDRAVWDKQPLIVRELGRESKIYKFFRAIFDVLRENYLDEGHLSELVEFTVKDISFNFLAKQLFMSSATGNFLDEHGKLYGVFRQTLEPDKSYRARIELKFNFIHKVSSINDLKVYAKDATRVLVGDELVGGYDIRIYDGSSIGGFISTSDYPNPRELVMCLSNTLYTYKLIEYKRDDSLDSNLLREVLDDVISPYLTYVLREVSEAEWSLERRELSYL